MMEISEKTRREIEEKFTRYEIARILGARALQIAINAPILIKLSKQELEEINYDPLKIAEIEFYADVLPITVKRPLPKKFEEKGAVKKVAEEEKEKKPKREEKKEIKEVKEEKAEGKIEEKLPQPEVEQPEAGTLEEVEQTEIMEMATPEDEVEEGTVEEEGE